MVRLNEIRAGELAVELPAQFDAQVYFIGTIRTPWSSRLEAPRQGRLDGPTCRIEMFEPWQRGLANIEEFERLEVLYWLHQARRDLVRQSPRDNGETRGLFALRTPARPNPIGTSIVTLKRVEGPVLFVRGLDCLDGTPLIDLKPDRSLFKPQAPARPGDFQTGDKT